MIIADLSKRSIERENFSWIANREVPAMRYIEKVEDLASVDRQMCAMLLKYRKSWGFVVVGVMVGSK